MVNGPLYFSLIGLYPTSPDSGNIHNKPVIFGHKTCLTLFLMKKFRLEGYDELMSDPETDSFRPLKDALGRFATGIAIATCRGTEGEPIAITVNSFTSVSLTPPLVLWCIEKNASTFDTFMNSDNYGISILAADQQAYSDRFAGFEPEMLKPEEMVFEVTGVPIIKSCLAAFDCKVVDRHEAGDHIILIGEVVGYRSEQGAPLIYFASQYAKGPHTNTENE